MTATAPSGVVTFLFTDVEGSTRRWETDADAMRAELAAHDEVLRQVIEAHGGFMFKHTGDGVCAAFASPRSAVDAAVAAQRALELPVRMGIATGEAELREGDYRRSPPQWTGRRPQPTRRQSPSHPSHLAARPLRLGSRRHTS
jgi:class 3 adenylate cyclase